MTPEETLEATINLLLEEKIKSLKSKPYNQKYNLVESSKVIIKAIPNDKIRYYSPTSTPDFEGEGDTKLEALKCLLYAIVNHDPNDRNDF